MANLTSSKKRIRSNQKKEKRNVSVKSAIKTAIKNVEDAVTKGNMESARTKLSEAVSVLDSAVAKGIVKKNTASREKSHLAKIVNAAQSAA